MTTSPEQTPDHLATLDEAIDYHRATIKEHGLGTHLRHLEALQRLRDQFAANGGVDAASTWSSPAAAERLRPGLEDRLRAVIVERFESMGEAWTTDTSGDTLARAAAEVAAREVLG